MSDFSHLQKLQVQDGDTPHEFELYEIESKPLLHVRCTNGYAPYENSIRAQRDRIERDLKRRQKGKKKGRRRNDQALLELMRAPDREVYPGTIVYGWTTNTDADGNEVEYTDEDCAKFLAALPDWLFDRIRLYCMDPQNFVDQPMTPDDEEELTGN